ncbi:MAG: hypothetical protein KDC03_03465, partial [Flavobacteriales bacterium]|nr:hypothetical protein [Flavobacteriales bacterium]MCB0784893.1 hypothetical protein [Flavobacteriales bacterium]
TAIVFSSDRTDDTLRANAPVALVNGTKDLFLYDLESRSNILKRLTNTPGVNEVMPSAYDTLAFTYLSDRGGLWNRHLLTFDSVVSHIDTTIHYRYVTDTERLTDYRRSILEQDFHAQRGRFTQLLKEGGKYRFYQGRIGQGGTALQEREAAPGPDTREMPGEVLTDDLTPVVKVDPQVPRQRTPDDVDIT